MRATLHAITDSRFISNNQKGAILGTSLVLMAVLTLLGSMAIMSAMTDAEIAGNFKTSAQAFNDAEAGIHHTLVALSDGIAANTLSLNGSSATETYTITTPPGFSFDPATTFTRVGSTRNYRFQVTGHAGEANSTIEVTIRRAPLLSYGLFGNEQVDFASSRSVYSYNSDTTPNPTATDSTGNADIASNGGVHADNDLHIDGDVALGDDGGGTEASFTYAETSTVTVTGQSGTDVSRITPDPMGASGGSLATEFTNASVMNDNALAGIAANTIDLSNGDSLTLTAGTYYLDSVTLNLGSTLHIDSGSGEVKIYLTGKFDAKAFSFITFTGLPTDFTIYSNSNQPIKFNNVGAIKGMVYAPYADIEMNNILPATSYGLVWGKTVAMDADMAGDFYVDQATREKFLSDNVSIVSWRDIRN